MQLTTHYSLLTASSNKNPPALSELRWRTFAMCALTASNDNTLEIIKSAKNRVTQLISEPDYGILLVSKRICIFTESFTYAKNE